VTRTTTVYSSPRAMADLASEPKGSVIAAIPDRTDPETPQLSLEEQLEALPKPRWVSAGMANMTDEEHTLWKRTCKRKRTCGSGYWQGECAGCGVVCNKQHFKRTNGKECCWVKTLSGGGGTSLVVATRFTSTTSTVTFTSTSVSIVVDAEVTLTTELAQPLGQICVDARSVFNVWSTQSTYTECPTPGTTVMCLMEATQTAVIEPQETCSKGAAVSSCWDPEGTEGPVLFTTSTVSTTVATITATITVPGPAISVTVSFHSTEGEITLIEIFFFQMNSAQGHRPPSSSRQRPQLHLLRRYREPPARLRDPHRPWKRQPRDLRPRKDPVRLQRPLRVLRLILRRPSRRVRRSMLPRLVFDGPI